MKATTTLTIGAVIMWLAVVLIHVSMTVGMIACVAELVVRLTTGHWIR